MKRLSKSDCMVWAAREEGVNREKLDLFYRLNGITGCYNLGASTMYDYLLERLKELFQEYATIQGKKVEDCDYRTLLLEEFEDFVKFLEEESEDIMQLLEEEE